MNSIWRDRLGPVGVHHGGTLMRAPAAAGQDFAAQVEALGYGSLWIGESIAKEIFSHAGLLLAASERLVIGTGIANVLARDPYTARAATATLGEAYPGRFMAGIGISHGPIAQMRGQTYDPKPYTRTRDYLDGMEKASYAGPPPAEEPPVVLAALRTKMLGLARDRTAGAHPYFVPASHTERARAILGPDPLLIPEVAVVVEPDPVRARELAREHAGLYLTLPNYTNNLLWLGFEEDDFANGGSDRLIDAVVAWGTVDAVSARVREHLDAGADHVLIQPIAADGDLGLGQLRDLAPALLP